MKRNILIIAFIFLVQFLFSQTVKTFKGNWYPNYYKPYRMIVFNKDSILSISCQTDTLLLYNYYIKNRMLILNYGEYKLNIVKVTKDTLIIRDFLEYKGLLAFTRKRKYINEK